MTRTEMIRWLEETGVNPQYLEILRNTSDEEYEVVQASLTERALQHEQDARFSYFRSNLPGGR